MNWGRRDYSWEDVRRLLRGGWKPRIKKQDENRFITIRNEGRERGLGSYTEEKWNLLQEEMTRIEEEGREDEIMGPSFEELYQDIDIFKKKIQLLEGGLKAKDAEIHKLKDEATERDENNEKLMVLLERLIEPSGFLKMEHIYQIWRITQVNRRIKGLERIGADAEAWKDYRRKLAVRAEILEMMIERIDREAEKHDIGRRPLDEILEEEDEMRRESDITSIDRL